MVGWENVTWSWQSLEGSVEEQIKYNLTRVKQIGNDTWPPFVYLSSRSSRWAQWWDLKNKYWEDFCLKKSKTKFFKKYKEQNENFET